LKTKKNPCHEAVFSLIPISAQERTACKEMIRLFTTLCKLILNILTDENVFWDATYGYNYCNKSCPRCGAKGKLSSYGDYSRWLIFIVDKSIVSNLIHPHRFKCMSCRATHALLPDIITPYSPYSLRFRFTVLLAYYERDTTVEALCEHFKIAVSTLYEWRKLFLMHKGLLLGILMDKKESVLNFLRGLLESTNLSDQLSSFYRQYKFSFMQAKYTAASRCVPP
jgi:transposase-like protein